MRARFHLSTGHNRFWFGVEQGGSKFEVFIALVSACLGCTPYKIRWRSGWSTGSSMKKLSSSHWKPRQLICPQVYEGLQLDCKHVRRQKIMLEPLAPCNYAKSMKTYWRSIAALDVMRSRGKEGSAEIGPKQVLHLISLGSLDVSTRLDALFNLYIVLIAFKGKENSSKIC